MKKPSKLLIFCLIAQTQLDAAEIENLEQLQQIAQTFVEQQLAEQGKLQTKAQVGRLDVRLQLPACSSPPEGFLPSATQKSLRTIGLRCSAPTAWSIYLPVQIQSFVQTLVAARELPTGERVAPTDFELGVVDSTMQRDSGFQDSTDLSGAKVKRRIPQGQAISSRDLCLICQGDPVSILAGTSNMQIEMPGIALMDGLKGQTIRVRNASSRKEVMARIESSNTVVVP